MRVGLGHQLQAAMGQDFGAAPGASRRTVYFNWKYRHRLSADA